MGDQFQASLEAMKRVATDLVVGSVPGVKLNTQTVPMASCGAIQADGRNVEDITMKDEWWRMIEKEGREMK